MTEREAQLAARVAELEARVDDMFLRNEAVKLLIDPTSGAIVDANPAAADFYGYTVEELRHMKITDLNQLPAELVQREMARANQEKRRNFEFKHRLRSGEIRDVQVYSGPCRLGDRRLLFSIICDITERNRLAEQLAHAQRMEALGRLAGGVAHDFNNLLAALEMLSGLLMTKLAAAQPVEAEVEEVRGLVQRGAGLTRQLLAFCRRQVMRTVLIDASALLSGMARLLLRALGEGVHLEVLPPAGPLPVVGDPTQFEQIVLNLALNARDAMPGGGKLSLALSDELLDARSAAAAGVPPGRYACLRVSDTGVGLSPDEQRHIFEPFFTTKAPGKGTGLGLSTVYGVTRQWGGNVTVESAPGVGSTFRVWLPVADELPMIEAPAPPPAPASRGHETILFAEDDPTIRRVVIRALTEHGYRVIEAEDGLRGLIAARVHAAPIDLLLTDVVMPRMGGRALAAALTQERPDLRVLYLSGHIDQPAAESGLLDAAEFFLAKPFSLADLLGKIRAVLEQPPRRPPQP